MRALQGRAPQKAADIPLPPTAIALPFSVLLAAMVHIMVKGAIRIYHLLKLDPAKAVTGEFSAGDE